MPYTSNPHLPKLRMRTVLLVRSGWSIRAAARHVGVEPSTVSRWVKKAPPDGRLNIPTLSSARHTHPNALDEDVVKRVVELRFKLNRCSEVIHEHLILEGIKVSLRSVKRTLDRHNLLKKRSPHRRPHILVPRPNIEKPGDLIQIDTIHLGPKTEPNFYVYTLMDVFSRWAYAIVSPWISTHRSLRFVKAAQEKFPSKFQMLQSDNGPEFSKYFSLNIKMNHRHTRVRKPNDNAHLERFNRTIQEECFSRLPFNLRAYQKAIPDYLEYYNSQRLHLGLQLKTPLQMLRRI